MASMIEYRQMLAARDLAQVWPQWRIVRLLGAGSFGEVYEIQRDEYGRVSKCALKIIRKENNSPLQSGSYTNISRGNTSEEFISTVLKEIDIMEKLKGAPNIVVIEDYEVVRNADSCAVLIRMELLRNIGEFMAARQQVTVSDVIRIGTDICNALEYCEGQNIIHRDVKESNIFYSDMGMFKLGDFGISRQLSSYLMNNVTMTSAGTVNKMAPEVYNGEKYDHRVDIYSLGMVLYSLLNYGRPPFYPMYPAEVSAEEAYSADMTRIKGTPIPPLQGVDKQLSQIICKACSPKPNGRYRTAAEFRDALLGYYEKTGGKHAVPAAPSVPQPEADGAGTGGGRGGIIGIAVVAAALVVIIGAIAVWQSGNKKKPRKPPAITFTETAQNHEEAPAPAAEAQEDAGGSGEEEEKEEPNYLEPEETDEEEGGYYGGASGQSILRIDDLGTPSKADGTTEEVDDETVALNNEKGKKVAEVGKPSWASRQETGSGANGGVSYYNSSETRYTNIYYSDGINAETYVSFLKGYVEQSEDVSFEILGDGSGEVNGREIQWLKLKEQRDNANVVIYWGAISCDGGCIAVMSSGVAEGESEAISEDDYLSDAECVSVEE